MSFAELRAADGSLVAAAHHEQLDETELLLDGDVPPGDYTLVAYQRGCAGDCAYLDPRSLRCATDITLADGERVSLLHTYVPGGRCTIDPAPD